MQKYDEKKKKKTPLQFIRDFFFKFIFQLKEKLAKKLLLKEYKMYYYHYYRKFKLILLQLLILQAKR